MTADAQSVPKARTAAFLLSPAVASLPPLQHRRETARSDASLPLSRALSTAAPRPPSFLAQKKEPSCNHTSPPHHHRAGGRFVCFLHVLLKHSKTYCQRGGTACQAMISRVPCHGHPLNALPLPPPRRSLPISVPSPSRALLTSIFRPSHNHPLGIAWPCPCNTQASRTGSGRQTGTAASAGQPELTGWGGQPGPAGWGGLSLGTRHRPVLHRRGTRGQLRRRAESTTRLANRTS